RARAARSRRRRDPGRRGRLRARTVPARRRRARQLAARARDRHHRPRQRADRGPRLRDHAPLADALAARPVAAPAPAAGDDGRAEPPQSRMIKLPDDRRPPLSPQLALRIAVLGGIALMLFAVVFFRLWYLQVLSGTDYVSQANDNQVREIRVPAPRGQIVDRNGTAIVSNRQA